MVSPPRIKTVSKITTEVDPITKDLRERERERGRERVNKVKNFQKGFASKIPVIVKVMEIIC